MSQEKLSSKQREVLDALNAGNSAKEVAKSLGISVTGVYGHMRRIEEKGYKVPRKSGSGGRKPKATASNNGTAASTGTTEQEIIDSVGRLVKAAHERQEEILVEVKEKTGERDALNAEIEMLQAEAESLSRQQENLETVTSR